MCKIHHNLRQEQGTVISWRPLYTANLHALVSYHNRTFRSLDKALGVLGFKNYAPIPMAVREMGPLTCIHFSMITCLLCIRMVSFKRFFSVWRTQAKTPWTFVNCQEYSSWSSRDFAIFFFADQWRSSDTHQWHWAAGIRISYNHKISCCKTSSRGRSRGKCILLS